MISLKPLFTLISAIAFIAVSKAQDVASVHVFAPSSALAEGSWVKVALDGKEDGVYEITYSQLSKMGFNKPDNVGVYGFGGHALNEDFSTAHIDDLPEVATFHDTANKRILFYGRGLVSWEYDSQNEGFRHRQNTYATRACYFLHQKDTTAIEMKTIGSGSEAEEDVETYDVHLLHEQDLVNVGHTGREMYGESFAYTQSQQFKFDTELQPGTMRITANFISSSPTASFSIKHNDEVIGSVTFSGMLGTYTYALESTFRKNIELSADHTPSLRINFNGGSSVKLAHLNYIRIEGKQEIAKWNSQPFKLFRNIASREKKLRYVIGNQIPNFQIWDVTDPTDIKRQELGDENSFTATEVGLREYAAVDCSSHSFPGVKILGNVKSQNLHAVSDIDLVIVTAPGLKTYAQQLADFRTEHDGMKVVVVTAEEIFNEYSSGTADATAIRLFMKQVFGDKQRHGYLLLFGDGHYNNRQVESAQYYLINYETEASLVETSSTVCDDYFGFLDDNEGGKTDMNGRYTINGDVVDIGVGRIPVHSPADAEAVVKKIIDYSSNYYYGNWKNRLCFISDDDKITDSATDAPNVHMQHNDQVISVLQETQGHKEFVYQKIYLPAYAQSKTASGTDYPDARKEFNEVLQQGALLVNYAGHGATTSITHEMLMTTARAAQLNMKHLPLWVTASCDISRWDDDEDSMGEVLFCNHNGGAIAMITTTRVVYASQNLSLNLAIAKCLFKRKADGSRYRLGDILMEAKQSLGSDYNKLNFCLLGDPSMLLSYPEYQMEISDIDYSDPITIHGRVIDPATGETARDFNGLVYPTIYDSTDSITADKGLHQEPVYTFSSRNRKIFSGREVIRDGEFQFSFITPLDMSDSSEPGLINLYACNENNDEGSGYYDQLNLKRPAASTTDNVGPEIRNIFFNSPEFSDGGIVGPTPYFFAEIHDPVGFNVTGNKVGHDATLTLRCTSNTLLATQQYVLNNYLTTYTGDPTTGNVRFTVPALVNGEYDVTFKVWDAMNNSSSRTLHIVVDDSQSYHPVMVQAYPSPVAQGEAVAFRVLHHLPEAPTALRLQIFTQTGVKVYDGTTSTSSSEVLYLNDNATSPTDFNNSLNADETSQFLGATTINWRAAVTPGIYIYKVYLSSGTGNATSESKLLMVK